MKEKIFIFCFTLILFFCLLNITFAKSITCVYGSSVSVSVGIDQNGNLITIKNDSNPVKYIFNSISSGAFINDNGNYYCPDKIVYTLSYNSETRRNDYVFSFISTTNYPTTLSLVNSKIDNSGSGNNNKEISKTCAYGSTGKYIINYYTDGTIGAADSSYHIYNDIPTTGGCLSSVYLCQGSIIYKDIQWNNNNCTKLSQFTGDYVQTDPKPNKPSNNTGSGGTAGEQRLDYNSWCSSGTEGNAGIRKAARIIGYVIAIAKWVVPMILIIFGIVDFTKASISSDDKALSKAASSLLKRVVAGLIVIFIPTIAIAILNFIQVSKGIADETNTNFGACTKCIFDPKNCN